MEKIWYTESQVFSKNWNSLLKRSKEIILEYFFILVRTYWKLTVQLIMSNSIFNLNPCQTSTFYSFSGRGFKMLSYSLKKKKRVFHEPKHFSTSYEENVLLQTKFNRKYLGNFSLITFLKTECLCCHLVIKTQLSQWLKSMLKMSSVTYNESWNYGTKT